MRHEQGAPRRAFFSSHLQVAVLLSLALHALAFSLMSWQRERPAHSPRRGDLEVRLEFFTTMQSDQISTRQVSRLPPQREEVAAQDEKPAAPPVSAEDKPSQTETTARPTETPPAVLGLAIPQQLPIPFPGKRPLWSMQVEDMSNAQAAYQAQRQLQVRLDVQARNQTASGQYEFYLRQALAALRLQAGCSVRLVAGGEWHCQQPADAVALSAVFNRLGPPPGQHAAQRRLLELSPDPAGGATRIVTRNLDVEPVEQP